jgi:hypothetical protein
MIVSHVSPIESLVEKRQSSAEWIGAAACFGLFNHAYAPCNAINGWIECLKIE